MKKHSDILYHGSPEKLELLKALNKHGDPGIDKAVFASPSKATALAYLAPWTDKDIMQMGLDGEYILGESRPGAFKELFDKPGYLHEVPADTFKPLKGRNPEHELVSYEDVKPVRVRKIKNILRALRKEGIKTVPYDRNSKYYKAFIKAKVERLRNMDKGDNRMYMNWLMDGENPAIVEDIRKEMGKQSAEHIFITGHSGSGKSTLAQQLADEQGLGRFNLDREMGGQERLKRLWARMEAGKATAEQYKKERAVEERKVLERALRLRKPRVIEGTQMLSALDLLKGTKHRKILVNPSEEEVIKRRLGRDLRKGHLTENSSEEEKAKRKQIAKAVLDMYRDRISRVQEDPEWEKVAAEMIHYVPADAAADVEKEGIKPVGRLSGEYGRKLLRRYSRFTGKEDADLKEILRELRRFRQHKEGENAVFGFPHPVDTDRHERLKEWLKDRVPYRINVDKLREDGLLQDAQNLDAPEIDYSRIPEAGPVLASIPHPRIITKGGVVPPEYLERL